MNLPPNVPRSPRPESPATPPLEHIADLQALAEHLAPLQNRDKILLAASKGDPSLAEAHLIPELAHAKQAEQDQHADHLRGLLRIANYREKALDATELAVVAKLALQTLRSQLAQEAREADLAHKDAEEQATWQQALEKREEGLVTLEKGLASQQTGPALLPAVLALEVVIDNAYKVIKDKLWFVQKRDMPAMAERAKKQLSSLRILWNQLRILRDHLYFRLLEPGIIERMSR
ncbi:MAG: hypothetical protein WCV84_00110 [Patescibacteria group bacterium]